jgi:hypothetical protein
MLDLAEADSVVEVDDTFDALHKSPYDGNLYVAQGKAIYQFDGDDSNRYVSFWQSAQFQLGAPVNFSHAQVQARYSDIVPLDTSVQAANLALLASANNIEGAIGTSPVGVLPIGASNLQEAPVQTANRVQFTLLRAGQVVFTRELSASKPFKLPAGVFTPTVHGEYVIQVERFRDIQEELHPLHVLHYAETERHRRGIALAPKYDRVRAMERAGCVVQFTARRHGELAAQLRLYLSESVHTASVVASEDALFLAPAHRPNAFLMIALLRYAEQVLIDLGAHEIHANSKKVNNAAVLMRRLGYDEVATQFIKIVKRKERSDVQ